MPKNKGAGGGGKSGGKSKGGAGILYSIYIEIIRYMIEATASEGSKSGKKSGSGNAIKV